MRINLTPYRYFVKIKLKSSKRRLSGKVNEIEQKDVKNDVISKKRDILSNKVLLNNLTHHKYFVKIKLSRSKRRLSRQVDEIEQNDVTIDVMSQKHNIVSKKDFFKVFLRSR